MTRYTPTVTRGTPYLFGRIAGKHFRKAMWMWQSFTGNEEDAIRAEHAVGRDMAQVVLESEGANSAGDLDVQALLNEIATLLADRVRNQTHRFKVTAITGEHPTAFALPGGFIFVAPALVELAKHDRDELAFVIGHEMAHVIRRHAIDRILSQKALSMASLATPTARTIAPWLRSVGLQWLEKAYSREQEFEADALGARLMQVAGFDANGAIRMLERFRGHDRGSDPLGLGAYISTHPAIDDRIRHICEQLDLGN